MKKIGLLTVCLFISAFFTAVKCEKISSYLNSTYSLLPEVAPSALDCSCKTITGKISDENGNPLSGVFVTIPGTETGVMTNEKGLYSIEVLDQPRIKLMFSFTGYVTRELTVDKFIFNVTLYPEPVNY